MRTARARMGSRCALGVRHAIMFLGFLANVISYMDRSALALLAEDMQFHDDIAGCCFSSRPRS